MYHWEVINQYSMFDFFWKSSFLLFFVLKHWEGLQRLPCVTFKYWRVNLRLGYVTPSVMSSLQSTHSQIPNTRPKNQIQNKRTAIIFCKNSTKILQFYSTSKIFCCKFFLLRALNLVVPKTCWTYDGAPAGGAVSTLLYFNPLHLYVQHKNTRPQELSKRYRVCPLGGTNNTWEK